MANNDKWIEEIADKLQNHASEVNPKMWQAVQSQIGANAAGAAGSALGIGKVAAIVVGIGAVSVATYFGLRKEKTDSQKVAQAAETKSQETTSTSTDQNEREEETITFDSKKEAITKGVTPVVNNETPAQVLTEDRLNDIEIFVEHPEPIRTIEAKKVVNEKKEPVGIVERKSNSTLIKEPTNKTIAETGSSSTKENQIPFGIRKAPNVFTPNGDGSNDVFEVSSEGLQNYSLVVLDKQNRIIWKTEDPNATWNGVDLGGENAPDGDYIYFVSAEGPNGEKVAKNQRLSIRR